MEEIIRQWNQGADTSEVRDDLQEITDELQKRTKPGDVSEREWLEQVVVDVLTEEITADIEVDDSLIDSLVDDFIKSWQETKNMSDPVKRQRHIEMDMKRSLIKRGEACRQLAKTNFSEKASDYLCRNQMG